MLATTMPLLPSKLLISAFATTNAFPPSFSIQTANGQSNSHQLVMASVH